jgi:hypothetical protein
MFSRVETPVHTGRLTPACDQTAHLENVHNLAIPACCKLDKIWTLEEGNVLKQDGVGETAPTQGG